MKIDFLTVALVLLGLAILWTLIRVTLKITARFFTLGCVGLLILVGGIWLISTVL